MKILMTGGTGLVGKSLGLSLVQQGHEVSVISRNAVKARRELPFPVQVVEGDLSRGPVAQLSHGSWDCIVNLVGENVGEGRWTAARKQRLVQSRLAATKNLVQSLRPGSYKNFISASAVGYYGDRGDEELDEFSIPGKGFLPDLCRDWEELALSGHSGARVAVARFGFILDSQEGGLPKLISLFQKGLGSVVGNGDQFMAWIHIHDVVQGLLFLIDHDKLTGTFNLVSPGAVRNRDFTKQLVEVLDCNQAPRVPEFVLKTAFGEMSQVILSSQKVKPKRLQAEGFQFKFAEIDRALMSLLGSFGHGHRLFEVKQFIPKPVHEVFPFFADAKNLERITPPQLHFHILKISTPEIQAGTLIDYKLKIRGLPVHWQTEIETWSPPKSFTDNQLKGPYSRWHHVHHFETLAKGTLMTDSVTYKLPLGLLGRIGGSDFVESDVFKIFDHRRHVIQEIFG